MEKDEISKGLSQNDLADSCELEANVEGTCDENGAKLTQPRSGFDLEDARRQLIALRKAYGADTPMGHACSNVVEQLGALLTYVRPAWATDERQTLPYLIGKQMERIAKLKGANH